MRSLLLIIALAFTGCEAKNINQSVVLIECEKEVNIPPLVAALTGEKPGKHISHGSATGFEVNGHLVTCHHVIDSASKIMVITRDGRKYQAEVVCVNEKEDLAELSIKGKIPSLILGNVIESKVFQVGNPMDMRWVKVFGTPYANQGKWQLFDLTTLPGNSGSPICNLNGNVVGMTHGIMNINPRIMYSSTLKALADFLKG